MKEIPAVALQEAKGPENQLTVEMPLPPRKLAEDPALAGIDVAAWPPLAGYNRSRGRLHAWTPLVISPKNEPLLARMRYGRGQTAAFLSSATPPWAGRMDRREARGLRSLLAAAGPLSADVALPHAPSADRLPGRPTGVRFHSPLPTWEGGSRRDDRDPNRHCASRRRPPPCHRGRRRPPLHFQGKTNRRLLVEPDLWARVRRSGARRSDAQDLVYTDGRRLPAAT